MTWTARNQGGRAAPASWYDTIYASRDPYLERDSDIRLGSAYHVTSVAPGDPYAGDGSFRLPLGVTGRFYIFVDVDAGNYVYERNAEANNSGHDAQSVSVTLAPPANLLPGTITLPPSAVSGQDLTLTCNVRNESDNAAEGSWQDALYISSDDRWDIDDPLLIRVDRSGPVPAHGSYTVTTAAPVPGILPGNYHVILRTDIRNQVPEADESDNVGASLSAVAVDAESLALGIPSTGSLGAGRSAFYRVDVPEGQTLLVQLDSASATAANELYLSFGEVPSRNQFGYSYTTPFAADQDVVVPVSQAGTYYILVHCATATAAANYTITAGLLPFAIRSADPVEAGNTGDVTLKILGARFTLATTFELIGAITIPASRVTVMDAGTAYAHL